jgi:hypothetical protein
MIKELRIAINILSPLTNQVNLSNKLIIILFLYQMPLII